MTYIQAKLRMGTLVKIAWIEKKKGLKIGSKVTLITDGSIWVVEELYAEMDKVYLDKVNYLNSKFGTSLNKE